MSAKVQFFFGRTKLVGVSALCRRSLGFTHIFLYILTLFWGKWAKIFYESLTKMGGVYTAGGDKVTTLYYTLGGVGAEPPQERGGVRAQARTGVG